MGWSGDKMIVNETWDIPSPCSCLIHTSRSDDTWRISEESCPCQCKLILLWLCSPWWWCLLPDSSFPYIRQGCTHQGEGSRRTKGKGSNSQCPQHNGRPYSCYAQRPKGSRGLLTLNGRCSRRDRLPFSSVGGWWSIELPRDDDTRGRTSRILIIV